MNKYKIATITGTRGDREIIVETVNCKSPIAYIINTLKELLDNCDSIYDIHCLCKTIVHFNSGSQPTSNITHFSTNEETVIYIVPEDHPKYAQLATPETIEGVFEMERWLSE